MHVLIRIRGHLDTSWQEWLKHLQMVHEEEGTSRLSGMFPIRPPSIYGVLHKLDRLSLMLLSLERHETPPEESC